MSIRIVLAASAIALIWMSAPLARADEASKEKILSELIEVMQYGKMADQMNALAGNQVISQLKIRHPDLDAEAESKLREMARNYMSDLMAEMNPMVSEIMSTHFTEEDLRAMLAFHKSPVGQKSLEKMPLIMQEVMTWSQQKAMTSIPGIMERMEAVIEEMKAKSGQ